MIHIPSIQPKTSLACRRAFFLPAMCVALLGGLGVSGDLPCINAQEKPAEEQDKTSKLATVKGKVEFDPEQAKSWRGEELKLAFPELEARLREFVTLPPPPFPDGYQQWDRPKQLKWQAEFAETEQGKQIIERNKKLLAEAHSFDIKFEADGSFVIFDVPAGEYGIQGRVDKEIGGQNYAFEVFGNLEVKSDVDEVALAPLRIAVTPLLSRGTEAPSFEVTNHDGKQKLTRDSFGDKILLVNFWSYQAPTSSAEQKMVQGTFVKLKNRFDIQLVSINVDEDRDKAVKFLLENQLREGSHGFTQGMDHDCLLHYGVRGVPSFWLIGKDDKILMNQYEFAQMMRLKPELADIVSDRIEGKDEPTPAEPEKKAP